MKYAFGEKLREIREKRGLTLREVAKRAHVSESLISQIERNKVSPAIDTLFSLVEALDTDIEYIFQDYRRSRPLSFVPVEKRESFEEVEGTLYERLAFIPGHEEEEGIVGYYLRISPYKEKRSSVLGHKGKELGIILKGEGEFVLGGQVYSLKEGDSIAFESGVFHVLRNVREIPLEAYWIVTPPKQKR